MANERKLGILGLLALVLTVWLGAGCRTAHGPSPDSLASVLVNGKSRLEVAHAVEEVFQREGYQTVPQPQNDDFRLVFDLAGTTTDTVLYGDWSSGAVWYRAKVRFQQVGETGVLVTCDAFRVLEHDDRSLESEHKLSRMKSGRYQALLERAKAQLK